MARPKIDLALLDQMVRQGKTTSEIAKHFSCTSGAVSQAKRRIKVGVIKSVGLEAAHKVIGENLNVLGQYERINSEVFKIIDALSKSKDIDDRKVVLRACREIKSQLNLALDILKSMHDFEAVAQFQREVLSAIAEEAPSVRDKIVRRLKERNALRRSVSIS